MKKRILITGGPVHAYLDDVKIITNRFKGGRMFYLAESLSDNTEYQITYLTSKHTQVLENPCSIKIVYHDGFEDYMKQVIEISKESDAAILGAAVANLIPKNKINGKFPSHNYNVGDTIPIEFTIAPRVINEIKKANPNIFLCGFKLLSGVSNKELVNAAYEVIIGSKANLVVANDATNLNKIYLVTKEKSVIPKERENLSKIISDNINDKYFKTKIDYLIPKFTASSLFLQYITTKYKDKFNVNEHGYMFGCIAELKSNGTILISKRGKKSLDETVVVSCVDFKNMTVTSYDKASLNAPLLFNLFCKNSNCKFIIHFHEQIPNLPTLGYAPPGTERDSIRDIRTSFNIEHHGCFLMFDESGTQI